MPMVKCNLNPDYEIQAQEADFLIVILAEAKLFDQNTGEKLSRPKVEKYRIRDFERMDKMGFFKGKDVEILHDPRRKEEELLKKEKELLNKTEEK